MFRLFQRHEICDRERLIREIARAAARDAVRRLGTDTATMSDAELRGYIRARAMNVVRAQIRHTKTGSSLQAARSNELVATILERTVHLVVSDLQVQPVTAIQAPHVRLRIAA